MRLTRSIFLVLGALALGVAAQPAAAQQGVALAIRDEGTGATLPAPKGWFVASPADALDSRKVEFGSAALQKAVRSHKAPKPQAIVKYKEPTADLNPSVQLQSGPAPAPDINEADYLATALVVMRTNMNQASVAKPVTRVKLGGRPAAHAALNYAFTYQGKVYPARSDIWIVRLGDRFLTISATTKQDQSNGKLSELRSIVARVAFPAARAARRS